MGRMCLFVGVGVGVEEKTLGSSNILRAQRGIFLEKQKIRVAFENFNTYIILFVAVWSKLQQGPCCLYVMKLLIRHVLFLITS